MNSIGAFGKLPALAEFISWRLPTEFTVPWHAWLVRGMADARNRIGPAFEDAFAMAPVWRFALPAGAAGSAAVRGILMPSTDAAGRLFPLCLALCTKAGASTPAASWFNCAEALARRVLEPDFRLDAWQDALAGFGADPADWQPDRGIPWNGWVAVRAGPDGGISNPAVVAAVAEAAGVSCFWSDGSPFVAPGAVLGPGLPEGLDFTRLLHDPASASGGEVAE